MLVKYLVSMSGSRGAFDPGHVGEVEDQEAARLIEAGYVQPFTREVKKETAVDGPREIAAEKTKKDGKR